MKQGLFILVLCICFYVSWGSKEQPNIVVIMADDAGWNDFGFHGGNQIFTPNIDALAYNGVILNRFYTQPTCTPSRFSFVTGNYPIRNGDQGIPTDAGEDRHLPENMPTLMKSLKNLNYSTSLIGKWHLGAAKKEHTPNGAGFDYFFGYHYGWVGYFNYIIQTPPAACNFSNVPSSIGNPQNLPCMSGYSLYENYCPVHQYSGQYATTLFTEKAVQVIKENEKKSNPFFLFLSHLAPHSGKDGDGLEVPDEEENDKKFSYISNTDRRHYAGIMNELDNSVGKVVSTLEETGQLDNTIIVFLSDNGPQTEGIYRNKGSAWPFRGVKFTPYEGGVRGSAVLYSSQIKRKGEINNQLMHITDLFPTLYVAAGGRLKDLGKIDGFNQWSVIKDQKETKRKNILINIDESMRWYSVVGPNGQYKLVNGTFNNGIYDQFSGDTGRENTPLYNLKSVLNSPTNKAIQKLKDSAHRCTSTHALEIRDRLDMSTKCDDSKRKASNDFICKGMCLFDLFSDPCETTDIASGNKNILDSLEKVMLKYLPDIVPQRKFLEIAANPIHCNNTWFPWKESKHSCYLCDPKCF